MHRARHLCAQNADHLAHDSPFSAFFTEVVCVLGAAPPQAATSQPQNGGNDAIQASDTPATRRQRASHGAKPPLPPQSEATPWFAGRGLTAYGSHALQTSSIWSILKRPSTASVTNVVNLSRKTSIFNEKGVGLTTFVTKHKQARPIGGHREAYGARLRCRWAVAGPGRASRSTTPSRRLACGDLAGGRARRHPTLRHHTKQQHQAAANKRSAAGPEGIRHSGSTHRHVHVP